jgi:hypothetical protein
VGLWRVELAGAIRAATEVEVGCKIRVERRTVRRQQRQSVSQPSTTPQRAPKPGEPKQQRRRKFQPHARKQGINRKAVWARYVPPCWPPKLPTRCMGFWGRLGGVGRRFSCPPSIVSGANGWDARPDRRGSSVPWSNARRMCSPALPSLVAGVANAAPNSAESSGVSGVESMFKVNAHFLTSIASRDDGEISPFVTLPFSRSHLFASGDLIVLPTRARLIEILDQGCIRSKEEMVVQLSRWPHQLHFVYL